MMRVRLRGRCEDVAGELPTLEPLDLIGPAREQFGNRIPGDITIKVVQLNQQLWPILCDRLFGANQYVVLGTFDIHLENVRADRRFLAKIVDRYSSHVVLSGASRVIHRTTTGVWLVVGNANGDACSARIDSLVNQMD